MEFDNGQQTLQRLDAYLPALNTGFMDGRIQDVIIQHPLVRALLVPEADMEARRRCIQLAGRIVDAATPVLPLILQEFEGSDLLKIRAGAGGLGGEQFRVPELSLDAQSRLMTALASLAEKDAMIQFWLSHHISSRSTHKRGSHSRDSGATGSSDPKSTINLYLGIKQAHRGLADLSDRKQGAVCKAFWDLWDESYVSLAEIVGPEALEQTQQGRLFRPAGDAAIFINNIKATKKRRVQEQARRLSMRSDPLSGAEHIQRPMAPMSPPKSSGSPESVIMTDVSKPPPHIEVSMHDFGHPGNHHIGIPATHDNTRSQTSTTNNNNTDSELPLIDAGDIDYIIHEAYSGNSQDEVVAHHHGGPDEVMGIFTNIDVSGASDMQASTFAASSSAPASSSHLDLRQRIKMMEEGGPLEDPRVSAGGASTIIW
jgi:hypothetical protein